MKKRDCTILEKDFPAPTITCKTIQGIVENPRFFRGHVRTATGRIYQQDEFECRSKEVLNRKLP